MIKNRSKLVFGTFLRAKRLRYGWWDERCLFVRLRPATVDESKLGAIAQAEIAPNALKFLTHDKGQPFYEWWNSTGDELQQFLNIIGTLLGDTNITEPVTFLIDEKGREVKADATEVS